MEVTRPLEDYQDLDYVKSFSLRKFTGNCTFFWPFSFVPLADFRFSVYFFFSRKGPSRANHNRKENQNDLGYLPIPITFRYIQFTLPDWFGNVYGVFYFEF